LLPTIGRNILAQADALNYEAYNKQKHILKLKIANLFLFFR
jgi:hypothetical protein